jgi:organic hydroperoxide reductase OsmC/OhrA
MSSFTINLEWTRDPASSDFKYETFNRNHQIVFGGKQILTNSAALDYHGSADTTNPEELLAASLSSCHMMTLLAIASKTGLVVDNYKCRAEALLDKNEEGRMSVTEINLFPEVAFSGVKTPDAEQLKSLHEKAHRNCFIAQSIKTKVTIY